MKKAFVTVGVSASGKSTWARDFAHEQAANGVFYLIVERDRIRESILVERKLTQPGDGVVWAKWKWKWENEVTAKAEEAINNALTNELFDGVIVSDTNLAADRRKTLVNKLVNLGFEVEEKFFNITWDEAVKRDTARKNGVGVSVLADQFARLQKTAVQQYVGDATKQKAVIVDLDGTLAHMNGRSAFAWMKVGEDTVDEEVVAVIRGLSAAGYAVIVMSGRDSVCRDITAQWLGANGVPYQFLFMRPAGDMRKDDLIKGELFWGNVADRFNVTLVIDDRPQVLRFWRSIGLKTMALGNPLIEF